MSKYRYGNPGEQIEFNFGVRLLDIDQRGEYDQTGTDYLFTRNIIRLRAVISLQTPWLGGSSPVTPADWNESPIAAMKRLHDYLMLPRRPLYLEIGGHVLFDVQSMDADKGPKPMSVTFSDIYEGNVNVYIMVQVARAECGTTLSTGGGIRFASNRYTVDYNYDRNWYGVRTISGTLRINSDVRYNIDSLRPVVIPGVPVNYQRESSRYTIQADGLALTYQFVDRQRHALPFATGITSEGDFGVTQPEMGKFFAFASIALAGPPHIPKRTLMLFGVDIIENYLRRARPIGDDGLIVRTSDMRERMFDNAVSLNALVQVKPPNELRGSFGAFLEPFGNHPPGSPAPDTAGYSIPVRGTNPFLTSVAAAFRDPCLGIQQSGIDVAGTNIVGGADLVGQTLVNVVPAIPTVSTLTTSFRPQGPGIYTFYELEGVHDVNKGKVVMPEMRTGGTPVAADLHCDVKIFTLNWAAKRTDAPPSVPDARSNRADVVLLQSSKIIRNADIAPDGHKVEHAVSGSFTYLLTGAAANTLSGLVVPWIGHNVLTNVRQQPLKRDLDEPVVRFDVGEPDDAIG